MQTKEWKNGWMYVDRFFTTIAGKFLLKLVNPVTRCNLVNTEVLNARKTRMFLQCGGLCGFSWKLTY